MTGKIYSFDNFDIDVNSPAMLVIVIGISVGLLVGIAMSLICRSVSGKTVSALKKNGADSAENAKTLSELGLSKVWFIKQMIKPDSALFRAVGCTEGFYEPQKQSGIKKFWYEKFLHDEIPMKFDFKSARFYLPEEKRVSAELRFIEEKHPVRTFILSAVMLSAVCVFAIYAIPELLTMLDNLLTQIGTGA